MSKTSHWTFSSKWFTALKKAFLRQPTCQGHGECSMSLLFLDDWIIATCEFYAQGKWLARATKTCTEQCFGTSITELSPKILYVDTDKGELLPTNRTSDFKQTNITPGLIYGNISGNLISTFSTEQQADNKGSPLVTYQNKNPTLQIMM